MCFTVITGITISFLVSYKLSLIVLTPITLFLIFYSTYNLKKVSQISKKVYEKAGV